MRFAMRRRKMSTSLSSKYVWEKNRGSAIRIFLRHYSQIPADSLSLFNQASHFKFFDNGLK